MSADYYDDPVLIVEDWDSDAWDCAIRDLPGVGIYNERVMYTPSRLLVDTKEAAENKSVIDVLKRFKAEPARCEAAKTAAVLGLTIYTVSDENLIDAVRRIRGVAPGSASLEHRWFPGGNRVHGDDIPKPTTDPGDLTGTGSAGSGQTIFVLDTGLAPNVPFDVAAADIGPGDVEKPDDDNNDVRDFAAGHGTHLAGLIARTAPGARIVPRRLLTTPEGMCTELEGAQAIMDAGAAGANIISCSWGGTTLDDAPPFATARAIEQLPAGTVVVAAAGNSFVDQPTYPAACNGVIAVGSVGKDAQGTWVRTNFSNYGPWVDCCAPGVNVVSTFLKWTNADGAAPHFDGFATWSGTSMSCPQVAATIAAVASRDGIGPSAAAWKVVFDPNRPRVGPVGTLVVPTELPAP